MVFFKTDPLKTMYQTLLSFHNLMRWLVVAGLLLALYRAYRGYFSKSEFSKTDNAVRHWSATLAHIQLMTGIILYFQSPVTKHFLKHFHNAVNDFNMLFFGAIHSSLMVLAVVLMTIGSAAAKRKDSSGQKYKTMMIWFTGALLILLIGVPWPFSPLANRPYFR